MADKNGLNFVYPLIFFLVFGGVAVNHLEKKIENLKESLIESKILEEDVCGKRGEEFKEKFYLLLDGKRAYLEIDGKPVEQYFDRE